MKKDGATDKLRGLDVQRMAARPVPVLKHVWRPFGATSDLILEPPQKLPKPQTEEGLPIPNMPWET